MKKIYLNLIFTFVIGLVLFFLVIQISFLLSRVIPGDPVLPFLTLPFTPSEYDQMFHQLGLDRPLIDQYVRYIINMFIGNWGLSLFGSPPVIVKDLINACLTRTIDLLLLPLLIGTTLGILFGNLSIKLRNKWLDKSFEILVLIGLAIPLFFLGMLFQYVLGFKLSLFPTTGYKDLLYGDPPFVTGFRITDSLLSGELYYIPDYLSHFILPWSVLTIGIGSLTTFLVRLYLSNKSERRSIVPNSFNFGISFGLIFTYLLFVETTFGLSGVIQLLIQGIQYDDYYIINALIFVIPISFVILIVLSNLIFIGYGVIRPHIIDKYTSHRSANKELKKEVNEIKSNNKDNNQINIKQEKGPQSSFKEFLNYFYKKIKSPITIIGLFIVVFFILISIFPQILTPYSVEDAKGVYPGGAWLPPSELHPLGQCHFGRDVLARIIYSIRTSLIFVLIPIGIGLIGGLVCGIPMSLLNRRLKISSEILMILFFIYPMILYIIPPIAILGQYVLISTVGYGLLLIPFFTLLIAKTRLNLFEIMKKVIPYIPLFIGFVILLQSAVAFLGFIDYNLFSLGYEISSARLFAYIAPHAAFFPGLALFLLIIGFFLLYAGLEKSRLKS
jgi:peptide/nickel transport system permease protein